MLGFAGDYSARTGLGLTPLYLFSPYANMFLTLIVSVFAVGYIAIATEHAIRVNKSASALLTGTLCWILYATSGLTDQHTVLHALHEQLAEVSGILFFLLSAMTIVELIDAHEGFRFVTDRIKTDNKRTLLWIITWVTFFLSAALDNLTTAIVMTSILKKLIDDPKERKFFAGMVIIAANAGGAWSPIGDVTTTMLWSREQISTQGVVFQLFLPSVLCTLVPLLLLTFSVRGHLPAKHEAVAHKPVKGQMLMFWTGILALLSVPLIKTATHLPPFMCILLTLGIMWLVNELLHFHTEDEEKTSLSVLRALQKIDTPSVLFFLGILLAVGCLTVTGLLGSLAGWLSGALPNQNILVIAIGMASSVVDNVPLVAAVQGMYDMTAHPIDDPLWIFLAYCAGTGGSLLIIGSAAGVAVMGLERIEFGWYALRIGLPASLGYFAGAGLYVLMNL